MIIWRIPQKSSDWLIVASLVTENEEDEDDDNEEDEEPAVIREPDEC